VAGKTPLNAPNVINLGFRQDMPELYAAADAVILASHYEAFGLVGPEAILCGTPAIFSTTVGAAEVLSEQACLRFERTVPALREALKKHWKALIAVPSAFSTTRGSTFTTLFCHPALRYVVRVAGG
jgi:glycosyltransferase involved in cell wall biosynthesis